MKLGPILSRLAGAGYSNVQRASVSRSFTNGRFPMIAGCDQVAMFD